MEQPAQAKEVTGEARDTRHVGAVALRSHYDRKVEAMLDAASNTLQHLMQLLYLLGRDPAVPQDARHHVTAAQAEIALLSRFMRNSAEERSVGGGRNHVTS